ECTEFCRFFTEIFPDCAPLPAQSHLAKAESVVRDRCSARTAQAGTRNSRGRWWVLVRFRRKNFCHNLCNLTYICRIIHKYMTHRTFVVALVLLAAACSKKDQVAPGSGILLAHMDTLVSPGDDFDRYVNGGWLKNNEIPADKSSYGVAERLHEQAQENVRSTIEEAAKSGAKSGSSDQ